MSETEDNNVVEAADEEAAEMEESDLQVTVQRTGPCECEIRVEAEADLMTERYRHELAHLQQEVKLPGFRQGRAPIGLVERRMGTDLKNEVVGSVAEEGYETAVAEHDLSVVAQTESPDLENHGWQPGQPAEFVFKCEVMPQVELKDDQYKGLKIEPPALEVTDEMFEAERERFAEQFATWEAVEDGAIDWDDYVEAEVTVPDADWTENLGFFPRSEQVGPLSVEGMKGVLAEAKPGDEFDAEAEVIEEEAKGTDELAELAGQKVKVHLKLESATRRKVPELDEDLAKKLGMSSLEELDGMVRERLERNLEERKQEITRSLVVDQLLDNVPLNLPDSLVERAAGEEQVRTVVSLLRRGVPRDVAEKHAAETADQSRDAVARRIKASFLMRKIAEKERIFVTEDEVANQVRTFASRQGWREERAWSYLEERGMLRSLRADMREAETVQMLLDNADVNEISPEEFDRRHGGTEDEEAEE